MRKEDALEAKLQEARSLVLSTRTDLQYHGCHALWELACRPDNHSGFEEETFGLLCRMLGVWGPNPSRNTPIRTPLHPKPNTLTFGLLCRMLGGNELPLTLSPTPSPHL